MPKKKQLTHKDYDKNCLMLPVMPIDEFEKCLTEKSQPQENIFHGNNLQKGNYDINYAINLLKMIEDHCRMEIFYSEKLSRSLSYSVNKLRVSLEMEKDKEANKFNPKTFRCERCQEMYYTWPNEPNVKCPHCNN